MFPRVFLNRLSRFSICRDKTFIKRVIYLFWLPQFVNFNQYFRKPCPTNNIFVNPVFRAARPGRTQEGGAPGEPDPGSAKGSRHLQSGCAAETPVPQPDTGYERNSSIFQILFQTVI